MACKVPPLAVQREKVPLGFRCRLPGRGWGIPAPAGAGVASADIKMSKSDRAHWRALKLVIQAVRVLRFSDLRFWTTRAGNEVLDLLEQIRQGQGRGRGSRGDGRPAFALVRRGKRGSALFWRDKRASNALWGKRRRGRGRLRKGLVIGWEVAGVAQGRGGRPPARAPSTVNWRSSWAII